MFGTNEVIGKVIIDLSEVGLKYLEDDKGWRHCFTQDTPGINFTDVKEGQSYKCSVKTENGTSQVLSATLIKEN